MKVDPHYQRRRCSQMTLVFGNIRFRPTRIFAGVPWRGSVKRQWGNRKRRFSGLSGATKNCYIFGTLGNDEANIIIWYYLVPCRLSTDPKIHDLEWPCMAILHKIFTITINPLRIFCFTHVLQSLFISRDQRRYAEADRDPRNIWDPWKDCGSFVDATLSEFSQIRPTLVCSRPVT